MTTALAKAKARRARRPIYATVMRLVDPDTGESIGAYVPAHPIDRELAKERKDPVGALVRLEVKRPRNIKFHRLVHAIGNMLVENVDGFEHLNSHDAIKRVQRESGICCEEMEIDIPNVGKLMVKVPESLSFDEMDADRFGQLFNGITDHIDRTYAPSLTVDARAEYFLAVQRNS